MIQSSAYLTYFIVGGSLGCGMRELVLFCIVMAFAIFFFNSLYFLLPFSTFIICSLRLLIVLVIFIYRGCIRLVFLPTLFLLYSSIRAIMNVSNSWRSKLDSKGLMIPPCGGRLLLRTPPLLLPPEEVWGEAPPSDYFFLRTERICIFCDLIPYNLLWRISSRDWLIFDPQNVQLIISLKVGGRCYRKRIWCPPQWIRLPPFPVSDFS